MAGYPENRTRIFRIWRTSNISEARATPFLSRPYKSLHLSSNTKLCQNP